MSFNTQIPNELVQSILSGNCMVFVGAGLSMGVKRANSEYLPSWGSLLLEMLQFGINNRILLSDAEIDIRKGITDQKFLMVAQELSERLGPELFRSFLRGVFLDVGLKPSDVHKNLVKISFRAFLTTNYDTLIEGAYTVHNEGRLPPILTQEDLDKIPNPLKIKDNFVFKIHGDINRPETIILTSHDYQDSLFRRPAYRSFLETLFTTNTVLFLGFGLNDQDVESMLDKMASIFSRNNDNHFALIEKDRLSTLERKRLAIDKKISVIEYDNTDGSHNQVNEFLKSLQELTDVESNTFTEYEEKVLNLPTQKINYKIIRNKNVKKVFLSYSSKDQAKANLIAEKLKKHGIEVWMDKWSIKVGDSIVSRVKEGLKNSSCMIILLSPNYIASNWTNYELNDALFFESESKRPFIIPVLIEQIDIEQMPDSIRNRLYLDLSDDIDSNITKLVKSIM